MKPIFEADKKEVYYEDEEDEDFDELDDDEEWCPFCGYSKSLSYEECPTCGGIN